MKVPLEERLFLRKYNTKTHCYGFRKIYVIQSDFEIVEIIDSDLDFCATQQFFQQLQICKYQKKEIGLYKNILYQFKDLIPEQILNVPFQYNQLILLRNQLLIFNQQAAVIYIVVESGKELALKKLCQFNQSGFLYNYNEWLFVLNQNGCFYLSFDDIGGLFLENKDQVVQQVQLKYFAPFFQVIDNYLFNSHMYFDIKSQSLQKQTQYFKLEDSLQFTAGKIQFQSAFIQNLTIINQKKDMTLLERVPIYDRIFITPVKSKNLLDFNTNYETHKNLYFCYGSGYKYYFNEQFVILNKQISNFDKCLLSVYSKDIFNFYETNEDKLNFSFQYDNKIMGIFDNQLYQINENTGDVQLLVEFCSKSRQQNIHFFINCQLYLIDVSNHSVIKVQFIEKLDILIGQNQSQDLNHILETNNLSNQEIELINKEELILIQMNELAFEILQLHVVEQDQNHFLAYLTNNNELRLQQGIYLVQLQLNLKQQIYVNIMYSYSKFQFSKIRDNSLLLFCNQFVIDPLQNQIYYQNYIENYSEDNILKTQIQQYENLNVFYDFYCVLDGNRINYKQSDIFNLFYKTITTENQNKNQQNELKVENNSDYQARSCTPIDKSIIDQKEIDKILQCDLQQTTSFKFLVPNADRLFIRQLNEKLYCCNGSGRQYIIDQKFQIHSYTNNEVIQLQNNLYVLNNTVNCQFNNYQLIKNQIFQYCTYTNELSGFIKLDQIYQPQNLMSIQNQLYLLKSNKVYKINMDKHEILWDREFDVPDLKYMLNKNYFIDIDLNLKQLVYDSATKNLKILQVASLDFQIDDDLIFDVFNQFSILFKYFITFDEKKGLCDIFKIDLNNQELLQYINLIKSGACYRIQNNNLVIDQFIINQITQLVKQK